MLMQAFKTAADLGISDPQKDALIKTLVLLETGKLRHVPDPLSSDVDDRSARKFDGLFDMRSWAGAHPCGTVCCIGGTAEIVGNVKFGSDFGCDITNAGLHNLFHPRLSHDHWGKITPSQAATALRSYLTTGDAHWDLAGS